MTGTWKAITAWAASALFAATAADFSFAGRFVKDDNRRMFTFALSSEGVVTVRTLSYGGGIDAAGVAVAPGGFDPSVFLFSDAGLLIAQNRDGGCGAVSADPVTGECWDSHLRVALPAGTYWVVLTEHDNGPSGALLSDPFVRDGAGDFTGPLVGMGSTSWWDFFLTRRTDAYALDILGADSAQQAPVLGLVSSASYAAGPLSANSILSLFGENLACASAPQLLVNGVSAELLYAGSTQINFVVSPAMTARTPAILQVECGGNEVGRLYLDVADAAPALFTVDSSGQGQASILNQNLGYNGAAPPAVAAQRGSIVAVYGTGFGTARSPDADGLSRLELPVTATVGGLPAEVTYAGLVPTMTSGLQQVNVRIPLECPTGGSVPIHLGAGWHTTQPGTTLAVQ